MQGHCGAIDPRTGLDEGDVWDLATHPKLPIFATVGEDRSIRMWSLKEKRMPTGAAARSAKGRSVAWHPSEGCDHVAVGTFGGAVIVVDYVRGTTVAMSQHAPDGAPITALRYSPCGKFLGLACRRSIPRRSAALRVQSSWTRRTRWRTPTRTFWARRRRETTAVRRR